MLRNLNHLATFAALAETGSFSAAAKKLGLPPSTVTAHIAALEAHLGLQLAVRTTRKTRLTAQGRQLALDARRFVGEAESALARLEMEKSVPVGQLRISVPFAFASDLIGPVIGRFAARYPGIRVEIIVSNEQVDLIAGGFDLAVRVGPLSDSSLIRRKLASAANLLVASQSYLKARGAPQTLDDLQHHSFIGFHSDQRLHLTGPEGPVSLDVSPLISANDPKTIASIVAAGAGIAVLPRFLITDCLADGQLEIILPQYRAAPSEISIVHYGHSASNPKIEFFTAFLTAEMSANKQI
jgi:DNA-binding transcriptional LysR family regulator